MIDERLDDETLAAFLDGTLAADEGQRVMRVLATNPDVYAGFIEAAQVVAAVKTAAPAADVEKREAPRRPPWTRPFYIAVPLLAAAGIAGVLLLSPSKAPLDAVTILQASPPPTMRGPGSIAAQLGARWDEPGWAVTRGSESAEASTGTVARIGARVAQLEYAARASDTVAYAQVLASLRSLLGGVTGAGATATRLANLPVAAAGDRAATLRQLRDVTGAPAAFDAGVLLETTRLAMASGGGAFLSTDEAGLRALRDVSAALERSPPTGDWSETRAQLRALAALDPPDTARVRAHVDSALAAIPR